ncbi:FixH family protein [Blastochloris viridis]|uniref:Putative integral membrane protein linked to a cation pump n=1 Tax=Blastochloris viridis TaxID=1079 RepID=A0A0H5BPJ6_BLAVI|nr:FixH family protein [Blastochloris viridis]ALK10639.1 FixH [Blastochloris viridis]BAR99403.1 type cbb3 cytochrome oxidase biogenesis protein CcoH [Blastochloris viridis]CUU43302.1 putative integral membrane protein linked to a cation pump [Blastochloris viridis]
MPVSATPKPKQAQPGPELPRRPAARTLTGRAVLVWLLGFFALVFGVNGVMAWLALSSFSGTVVDSAYRASQRFNGELDAARAQAARHWAVTLDVQRGADGAAEVRLLARDGAGVPVSGVNAQVELQRPTDRHGDVALELGERGGGEFAGRVAELAAGQWDVVIAIAGAAGPVFRSRNRVVVP